METVSQDIKRVRAQMEENEQVAILMKGLRGQNLSDSNFAEDDVQLRLVEVSLRFWILIASDSSFCEILIFFYGLFNVSKLRICLFRCFKFKIYLKRKS